MVRPVGAVVATPNQDKKDKDLDVLVRYFAEADAIHREAWWVLNNQRPPMGKSPFGKVQRALLASQNIKLSNKSLFNCDRYLVRKAPQGKVPYPQRYEIEEKCSDRLAGKKIAELDVPRENEVIVFFISENLEEILGLGAAVLNLRLECHLRGDSQGHLLKLKCKDWAQERSKEQMIRLNVYDYEKTGQDLIKLRGKVYEHLMDIRKIEADVPLKGKIQVTETELYPAQVEPTPTPTPTPAPTPKAKIPVATPTPAEDSEEALEPETQAPESILPEGVSSEITPLDLPPPRQQDTDSDVMMEEQMQVPTDAQGNPLVPPPRQQPDAGGVYGR